MYVTCPACSTRYAANAENFPAEGRQVRCARCGHVWHQMPIVDADADIFEGGAEADGSTDPTQETVDDIRRNLDEEADAAMARRRARLGVTDGGPMRPPVEEAPSVWPKVWARMILGFGWAGVVALMVAVGWAVVTYRPIITQYWPQSASLYAMGGMKPDLADLAFADVGYRSAIEDGQPVLTVSGKLVNSGSKQRNVPPIRAVLYDEAKRDVFHWTFSPKALSLAPGQTVTFTSKIASPPSASRNLELRFAQATDL